MKTKKSYISLSIYGDKLIADYTSSADKLKKLSAGIYTIHYDGNSGTFWFKEFNPIADNILELDSPEYKQVTSEMAYFLKPEIRKRFKDMGYIYKRSALLHGDPGTGKTCIVNRVAKDVVDKGGIVLYAQHPSILKIAFEVLSDLQPETLTLAIFEEFDEIARSSEGQLLTMLDGEVQKENVMYLATTNYLEKVPKRLYRPGRFSSVIKVSFPNAKARKQYFTYKLGEEFAKLDLYVEKTSGLSIDELKEVIQSVEILGNDLDATLERLKTTREFVAKDANDEMGQIAGFANRLMSMQKLALPEPMYYSQDDNQEESSDDGGDYNGN